MNVGKTLFAQMMEFVPWKTFDLLPVSRTTVKFAESITMENDGHEDESI